MTSRNSELRKELDLLTTPPESLTAASPAAAWEAWLAEQVRNIAELAGTHPHSIRLHTQGTPAERRNCFAIALGLDPEATFGSGSYVAPGSKFVRDLCKSRILERKVMAPSEAAETDILIYLDGVCPRHAGKWDNGKVISKWGHGPTHVWKHALWDLPESYGHDVGVFRPISQPAVVKAYEMLAEHRRF